MPASTPRGVNRPPLSRFCYTIFYLKTWICPNETFFDPSINLCTGCPIVNCKDCMNLTVCLLCDEANDYFLNPTTGQCDHCTIVGCTNCNSSTTCLACDHHEGYILLPNNTCELCDSSLNYFADATV